MASALPGRGPPGRDPQHTRIPPLARWAALGDTPVLEAHSHRFYPTVRPGTRRAGRRKLRFEGIVAGRPAFGCPVQPDRLTLGPWGAAECRNLLIWDELSNAWMSTIGTVQDDGTVAHPVRSFSVYEAVVAHSTRLRFPRESLCC